MYEEAKKLIQDDEYSCVIVKNGNILHKQIGKGIKPLLELYKNYREDLNGAIVVDKIIGKAAASVVIVSGVKQVYAKKISKAGLAFLEQYKVALEYGELIDHIENRDKTDLCPMEKTALPHQNANDAFDAILEFIKA